MSTKRWRIIVAVIMVAALVLPSGTVFAKGGPPGGGGGHTEVGEVETAGNNLSYPVIWAEGVTKPLRGTAGASPVLDGQWWYWWGLSGTDPNIVPLSCPPDLGADQPTCLDGSVPGSGWVKAYLQKDQFNEWQAGTITGAELYGGAVNINWIDWGDNLESVDWYTRSQVRTEVVLYQDLATPMLEYQMRHTSGWGIDEVHGLAVDQGIALMGPGTQATVFSPCARLTIQKLLVPREEIAAESLSWDLDAYEGKPGWVESDPLTALVNPPIFKGAVHEAGDGPGYYNAEINVKGKIIYGYTWNVRDLNDMSGEPATAAGDYRITFSFDTTCGTATLNTAFVEDTTQIMVPLEEEEEAAALAETEGTDTGGATGILDTTNNLTYIDVRILERGGGGNGGGGKGGPPDGKGPGVRGGSVEEMASEECPPGADCDRIRDQDRLMEQDCDCDHECTHECECCQNGACDPNCDCPCNCEQEQAQEQEQEQDGQSNGDGEGSGEENQEREREQEREGPPNREVYLPLLATD